MTRESRQSPHRAFLQWKDSAKASRSRADEGETVAIPAAASSDRIEEHVGDVTYIRTDKDLPPVAIIDRSPITTKHRIIFGVIAVLGAVAWAIIAFFRGETVNAVWFVIAAVC